MSTENPTSCDLEIERLERYYKVLLDDSEALYRSWRKNTDDERDECYVERIKISGKEIEKTKNILVKLNGERDSRNCLFAEMTLLLEKFFVDKSIRTGYDYGYGCNSEEHY